MIKLVFCLRRLSKFSRAEFHRYWSEDHAALVREVAPMLGIRRYVQSHSFADLRLQRALDVRGSTVAMYDGIAELWWDSIEDIAAASATREGRAAGRRLYEDELFFIDLAKSPIFYSREHVVIG